MVELIEQYIDKEHLINKGDKVLIGVSGGADSVALLCVLHSLGVTCAVAHCNFQLRGEESDQDEEFVVNLCAELSVPLYSNKFTIDGSVQTEARKLRYTWFNELCNTHKFSKIAVAHHADDQVETFFINLLRGSGPSGLRGMKPAAGNVIRPMLKIRKCEIVSYLEGIGQTFRSDSSNEKDDYLRNAIRHRVIPALEDERKDASNSILQSMHWLLKAEGLVEQYVSSLNAEESYRTGTRIQIDKVQTSLSPSIALYQLLSNYGFSGTIIEQISVAMQGQSGKRFESETHEAIIDREYIHVSPITYQERESYLVTTKGIDNPILLTISEVTKTDWQPNPSINVAQFDAKSLVFPLTLRRWEEGDSFIPFGMAGSKKLSDFFIDLKLSVVDKRETWILESNGEIIWVVGHRIDNRNRVTDNTDKIIEIAWNE